MKEYPLNREKYETKKGSQNRFQIFLCKLYGLLIQIVFGNALRVRLCRAMGVRIGENVFLGKYCIVDDTFPELITIEDKVVISFGTTITTHDDSKREVAPVVIKTGVFLGTRSVILSGVIIGENSIVGAGSVVTKDVPADTIVGGVPARIIKKIETNKRINISDVNL